MDPWFTKPDKHKVTVVAPGVSALPSGAAAWSAAEFGEVDLCLVAERWTTATLDVESDTAAGLFTDHFPLLVRIRVKLRAEKAQARGPRAWDFKAASKEEKDRYDADVARAFGGVMEAASLDKSLGRPPIGPPRPVHCVPFMHLRSPQPLSVEHASNQTCWFRRQHQGVPNQGMLDDRSEPAARL